MVEVYLGCTTQIRARLAAISKRTDRKSALYVTPGGVTSGPGSMVHEMMKAAGLDNFEEQPGWRDIPLEKLAYEKPDVIAAAVFHRFENQPGSWSPMNHPMARQQLERQNVVQLEGAWTACSGWFIMDAIEALAKGGEE